MSASGRPPLEELLSYFAEIQSIKGHARCGHELFEHQRRCELLFRRDYAIELVHNDKQQLCSSYPLHIIVIKDNNDNPNPNPNPNNNNNNNNDNDGGSESLAHLFQQTMFTRVHGRFAVPTIRARGKNICRSATLSVIGESLFNQLHCRSMELLGYFSPSADTRTLSAAPQLTPTLEPAQTASAPPPLAPTTRPELPLRGSSPTYTLSMSSQRAADVALLRALGVQAVFDLMVEGRKRKLGLTVTSSEKVEPDVYSDAFDIFAVPYPGCEFFREYHANEHSAAGLYFDWSQAFVDAELSVGDALEFEFCWENYKKWDLVVLTQRYLRLLLRVVADPDRGGILLHCVSGWDRTPLFISLLRLSLWADGEAHASLNASEILYLTVAYDWMLFGHQLGNRLRKREDVFFFCFDFLAAITGDEYRLEDASLIEYLPCPHCCSCGTAAPATTEEDNDDDDDDGDGEREQEQKADPSPTRARSVPVPVPKASATRWQVVADDGLHVGSMTPPVMSPAAHRPHPAPAAGPGSCQCPCSCGRARRRRRSNSFVVSKSSPALAPLSLAYYDGDILDTNEMFDANVDEQGFAPTPPLSPRGAPDTARVRRLREVRALFLAAYHKGIAQTAHDAPANAATTLLERHLSGASDAKSDTEVELDGEPAPAETQRATSEASGAASTSMMGGIGSLLKWIPIPGLKT